MLKNHWKKIIIVILILVVGFFGINRYLSSSQSDEKKEVSSDMITEVKRGDLQKTISATGYVSPGRERELSFNSSDEIEVIKVEEGDRVEEDEVLMIQDQLQEKLDLFEAENDHRNARVNGSRREVRNTEMNLEIVQKNLNNTELKAPFSGIVSEVMVEEGDTSGGENAVVSLIDTSTLEIDVDVEENDASEVETGQDVDILVQALNEENFSGKVVELKEVAEESSGVVTLPVTVEMNNNNSKIKPGYSADVDIITGSAQDQVVVPLTAILNENGEELVLKVEDGRPERVPVTTGLNAGSRIAIEEGLEAGDEIIINAAGYTSGSQGNGQNSRPSGPPGPGGGF